MASVLQDHQISYQGRTIEQSTNGQTVTITYQGSKEALEAAQNGEFAIGTNSSEWGTIRKSVLTQREGPFWTLQITYEIDTVEGEFHSGGGASQSAGSSRGPTHSSLDVATISQGIECHPNYMCRWNQELFYCCTNPNNVTATIAQAATVYANAGITSGRVINDCITGTDYAMNNDNTRLWHGVLCWANSASELPSLPQNITNYDGTTVNPYWARVYGMTMPGVSTYDCHTYLLTQYSKHKTKSDAGWVLAKRAGKIAQPEKGDFGIISKFGGNWLCTGGSVQYDGKWWLAQLNYEWSGDSLGWREELYPRA